MVNQHHIENQIRQIRSEILAAQSGQSQAQSVEILAVTKYCDLATTQAIVSAGIRHLGENKVQSAITKIQAMSPDIHWSMIGHLQTNKVKAAVQHFDRIQSVDSWRLLDKIQTEAQKLNKTIEVFLQVNMTGETQKSGFSPDKILHEITHLPSYPNIVITGIMAFGPNTEDSLEIRAIFEKTRKLYNSLKAAWPPITTLSMGMSHDFQIAVECGANQVRIGQRLTESIN